MFVQQKQVNIGGKVYKNINQIGQGVQGAVFKGKSQQGDEGAIKYQNTNNPEFRTFSKDQRNQIFYQIFKNQMNLDILIEIQNQKILLFLHKMLMDLQKLN